MPAGRASLSCRGRSKAIASAMMAFVQHAVQEQEELALNAAGQYCLKNLINRVYVDHESVVAR